MVWFVWYKLGIFYWFLRWYFFVYNIWLGFIIGVDVFVGGVFGVIFGCYMSIGLGGLCIFFFGWECYGVGEGMVWLV